MSEEQAQQLMYQMQALENYYSELAKKESSIISVIRETSLAIDSLKGIVKNSDTETLVPIGLGTYVKAKIISDEKIVLNVGAGVAIEKTRNDAQNFLESKIKEMQVALQKTSSEKQHIMANLEQGKHQMEQMLNSAKKPN